MYANRETERDRDTERDRQRQRERERKRKGGKGEKGREMGQWVNATAQRQSFLLWTYRLMEHISWVIYVYIFVQYFSYQHYVKCLIYKHQFKCFPHTITCMNYKPNSQGARGTYRAPPPGTFHYGSKMYLRVSGTQSHLFPGKPLGCTGVIALCARDPLAFSRSVTERRSLMHHLNRLYIIILWNNGPNVV